MHSDDHSEPGRLDALDSYAILDTGAEDGFDRLTRLVARICATPMAAITFVDAARQWFKSSVGLAPSDTERKIAFCAHAIRGTTLFVVADAAIDPLFASNPLVVDSPGIRYYAGMPLVTPDGVTLGTLAVMDRVPRVLSDVQVETLQALAEQVMMQLALRRQRHLALAHGLAREQENAALLQVASEAFRIGGWDIALPALRLNWSDAVCDIHEVAHGTCPTLAEAIGFCVPESRRKMAHAYEACIAAGAPWEAELELTGAKGRRLWVRIGARAVRGPGGAIVRIQGALQDISRRKLSERALTQSEQRFRQLADAMPYIVWSADPSGVIDYGNRTIIEYTGLSDVSALGREWTGILHPDDVAPTLSSWADAVRTGEVFSCEYRVRRAADNSYRWHLAKGMPIRDAGGAITKWYGTTMDIHDSKLANAEIGRLAFYDPLTGLPNRQLLMDRLAHALALHSRSGHTGAVMLIDLDNFKTINDTIGHDRGDILLDQVAGRLSASVRESDTVARLGGDEFVILLEALGQGGADPAHQAGLIARQVQGAINASFNLDGYERHITPSIGVALFRGDEHGIGELLKRADLAMYQAKAAGRNTVCFFDPEIQAVALRRAALESELRQALQDHQFVLHYQPQVDGHGRITGVEALVRWQHPQRGMVPPAEFIALAEDTGLILPLGRWVLETACRQLALWRGAPATGALTMSVNVSALQFRHPDFVAEVLSVIHSSGADPRKLKLELTETLLLDDVETAIAKISAFKAHGVGFSLDDFGTGYSSLSYLKRLPLDQLKIDQSFVRNVLREPKDAAIVSTIITLGHTMGMAVIAEGVETAEQRDFLAAHGCQAYQGYLFSRPLPGEQLAAFLRSGCDRAA